MKIYCKKINRNANRRSIKAAEYDADTIKASVSDDEFIGMLQDSVSRLNDYFEGEVTFKATLGSVYGAKHTGLYEQDGKAFMLDFKNMIENNMDTAIYDYVNQYLSDALYLSAINGTEDEYIQEHISGEDMNNIDPTVDPAFVDDWYDMYDKDLYNLAYEMADDIAKYLTSLSMTLEDSMGGDYYPEDFEWYLVR